VAIIFCPLVQSADWQTTERTVVKHIVEDCQASTVEGITIPEMRRAVGVLEVNCYEVHSFVRQLFPIKFFLNFFLEISDSASLQSTQ
jgi:hypothetical protein